MLRRGSRTNWRVSSSILLAVAVTLLSLALSPAAGATTKRLPILFVHGLEGTGAQFESQALRFTSNGYPHSWIDEVDYNSTTAVADETQVDQQIDQTIAELKKRTGSSHVVVVAHSLGTSVMYDYLTKGPMAAQRRKNVAQYVNVDGQNQNPGVPTLALWAGIPIGGSTNQPATGTRHMSRAKNVRIPNQTHVQTCTSWQSFVQEYKFFTGARPAHDIVRRRGSIKIAGRALEFPQNTGLAGTTVQIWPLTRDGHRATGSPLASVHVTDGSQGGGAWGPVTVQSGKRYELALVHTGSVTLHIYYEPFVRSDYTLRLLDSDALTAYAGNRPGSASAVNIRYKELWGDKPASERDVLKINGTSVCTAKLCPTSRDINAYFAFDRNRDHKTELSMPDPLLSGLPFITGGDVFIPASPSAKGTVTFGLRSRGAGPIRTVKTANWDSTTDGIIVQWNDYEPSEVQTASHGSSGGGQSRHRRSHRRHHHAGSRHHRKASHRARRRRGFTG